MNLLLLFYVEMVVIPYDHDEYMTEIQHMNHNYNVLGEIVGKAFEDGEQMK